MGMRARLADFFTCCTQNNTETEVTLHLNTKNRPKSQQPSTPHIQTSILTHPIQPITITKPTAYSLGHSSHPNDNHYTHRRNGTNYPVSPKNSSIQSNLTVLEGTQKKGIQIRQCLENMQVNNDSPPKLYKPPPRILLQRKMQKPKGQILTTSLTYQPVARGGQRRILRGAPSLQTIEERLSMPSCSESQQPELNRMVSQLSVVATHDYSDSLGYGGQLGKQMSRQPLSCILPVEPYEMSSKLVRSQNLLLREQQLSKEHQRLIGSKMKMDIQIQQRELLWLMQEQASLREESVVARRSFLEKLQRVNEAKRELVEKLSGSEKRMGVLRSNLVGSKAVG